MFDFEGKLFIIRHAPTPENKKGLCLGRIENYPSDSEIEKIKVLIKKELTSQKIDIIISSSLNRAIVTAENIKPLLNVKEIILDKKFNDLDFGWFCGKSPKLIKEIQPEIYDEREFFKYDISLKEGESLEILERRVKEGLEELLQLSQKGKILLVTHGSVIVMIHKLIFDRDYYDFYPEVDINSNYQVFKF